MAFPRISLQHERQALLTEETRAQGWGSCCARRAWGLGAGPCGVEQGVCGGRSGELPE